MRSSAVGGPSLQPFPYPPLGADGAVQVITTTPRKHSPLSAILFQTLKPFSSIFFPTPQSHTSQQNTPSLRVTMVVPPDAFVGPNPQVGWWNENKREWDTDGITEISFDSETRRLTFASVRMTALSLVQSRVVSLPCVLSTPTNTTVYPY